MDWLAKALDLPSKFLSHGEGGGVIHGTASEVVVITLVAARDRAVFFYYFILFCFYFIFILCGKFT